ncbi:proliferation-associated 2g4, putative [Theileria equi strain WA]|uniref:Proliferation-associated 2g4, putative n=1 Tax=Theileria equi strain WA TaxID=1537102 RepID=L0AXB9_THEEQ|nr:proliferation-associated 2g4, putative [Theileria equi strain WA]AFZ80227.1 proliferation-associated 2g4, putative [Theileria equi strain WA]|eukprot:XP_004829893.1 proliferation-associated 2g4, putative [Theileria equi strain WA]
MASEVGDSPFSPKAGVETNENDLSNSDIVTKYRTASNIANLALKNLIDDLKPGISVKSLCDKADKFILEEVGKLYNKKENGRKIDKGIGFPTCICINEICDYFSPNDENVTVSDGDLVKITTGCHIDGYVGLATHTVFVGTQATGKIADVLKAAWFCSEAALRKIKVGTSSSEVSKTIEKVAAEFNCTPLLGFYSHELKRHVVEGSRYFPGNTKLEDRTESFVFGINEAYSLNIVISTSEGKPKPTEHTTTIYRTDVQNRYTLKTTLGRTFISQVNSKFPAFPFHTKSFEDERALKVGLPEALRHSLLKPYFVTSVKNGEFVAHFRCTVLLLSTGLKKITGLPFDQLESCKSEFEVKDQDLLDLLASPIATKKKKPAKAAEPAATE